MNEKELREQIAQEIEAMKVSFIRVEDESMIKTHPDCWKCGTPAQTSDCESANRQTINGVQRMFATIARGKK